MKAIEKYFHVVLFIIYAVRGGSNFQSLWMTIQMKVIEKYFHVVLFVVDNCAQ